MMTHLLKFQLAKWLMVVAILLSSTASYAALTPSEQQHFLNRIGYGATQADLAKLQQMGVDAYLTEQLHANQPLPQDLQQQLDQNPLLPPSQLARQLMTINQDFKSPKPIITAPVLANLPNAATAIEVKKQRDEQRQLLFKSLDTAAKNRRILLAVYNPNQLEEVMTDFWYNHFNIYSGKSDLTHLLYADFEQHAIRPYALGKFADLLSATAHHPAMLDYLDNRLSSVPRFDAKHPAQPAKGGINENYAREIMELHTLGVTGGYTQADVTNLARMLTGWGTTLTSIAQGQPFVYNPKQHDTTAKTWLKQPIAAGQQQAEGEQALQILAHSPATAQHIANELGRYFVSDNPPVTLTKRLTQVFLNTDGDIAQVLQVLFHSPEFWQKNTLHQKFKTPLYFVISSIRNSDIAPINPSILANRIGNMGMPLYGHVSPEGYDWQQSTWLSPDAIQLRLGYAAQLAQGKLFQTPKPPETRITYHINPEVLRHNAFADIRPTTLQHYNVLKDDTAKATLLLGSPEFMYY